MFPQKLIANFTAPCFQDQVAIDRIQQIKLNVIKTKILFQQCDNIMGKFILIQRGSQHFDGSIQRVHLL